MVLNNIHVLPLVLFVLIPFSFIVTYSIAVCLKHVEIEFPYISDTGAYVPESCIFSQLVNIVACLLAVTMYVRYKQIEQHYRDHLSSESTVVLRLNKVSVVTGWIGCFGVSLLANFQETSVIIVHMVGALMAFGSATVYCWLQTIKSFYVCPLMNSRFVARLRASLSFILTSAFLTSVVAGAIAHRNFHGKDATKWNPEDGGFTAHVISTAAEWILVVAFDFFLLTFVKEMKVIAISSPQVLFIIEERGLQTTEFFNSEDNVSIIQSQNSARVSSAPATPYSEYAGRDNKLTTHAIIH